jgi:prenyltransferase beta subunit
MPTVKFLPILLLLSLMCLRGAAQDARKFTNADGTGQLLATLLRVETDQTGAQFAVLRRKVDSKVVRINVNTLSADDIKYVSEADALLSVPGIMRGRLTPGARAVLRKKDGCNAPAAEAAVEKALQWLSTKQNADGSWGQSHRAAMTGLTLLAFAGHGYGPGSERYGKALSSGVTSLLEIGRRNAAPFHGVLSDMPSANKSAYEHPIATQALAEMHALSQQGRKAPAGLREAIAKAESIILLKQSPMGAWGYKVGIGYDPHAGNDLSLTGWQLHALSACRDAGFQNNNRSVVLKKAMNYLKGKQSADGGFGNPDRSAHYNQWNLTGSALSGLQSGSGQIMGSTNMLEKAGHWLVEWTKKEPLKWESECYLYTWYYNSLALHYAGGEAWSEWNRQCEPLLLANQNSDGSWKEEGKGEIAAATTGAAAGDKDIYRACLAVLILETPCRFIQAEKKK